MRQMKFSVFSLCMFAAAASACGDGKPGSQEEVGAEVVLALTNVPDGVGCMRITVAGTTSTQSEFDVKSGQSAQLRMSGLPIGPASFVGEAFDGACASVATGAIASWVGEPVAATLQAGKTTFVQLVLRSNGRALVSVDFKIDPNTGEPCVGSTPGCLDPADGMGPAGGLLPDGARLVGSAEFARGLSDATFQLTSPRIEAARASSDEKDVLVARQAVLVALKERPDLAHLVDPVVTDENTRRAANGDFEIDIKDNLGNLQTITTMSDAWSLQEMAGSLARFSSRANQASLYQSVFEQLPLEFRLKNQLPDPREILQLPVNEITRLNVSLAARLKDLTVLIPPEGFPPGGYPKTCANEEATPVPATDQTGGSCSPNGLWKNAPFLPLRWRATCVKNQARRGTCVSFGITGAAEAAIAVKHNRWVNLSEQRLYYKYKVPTAWGDGLNTTGVMENMVASTFLYPFEPRWDYNPSSSRVNVPALPPAPADPLPGTHYEQSCNSYFAEHCSNTSHQGDLVCTSIIGINFCGWSGTAPADSGFRLTNTVNYWSAFGPVGGSAIARLGLALKIPMVMSLAVVPSFDNASSSGIATYVGSNETSRGGHAVAVMGFVDNENLPAGTPPGAGGGYFIVKNSWGKCWKDGGYIYLPYTWVENYAYSLSSVHVN